MTTLKALDAATQFLRGHPNVADLAFVCVGPEGGMRIQLVADRAPEAERTGILMGLAAVYSGDLRTDTNTSQMVLDITWSERTVHLFTPLARVAVSR